MNREEPGGYWGQHQAHAHFHSKGSNKGSCHSFRGNNKKKSWLKRSSEYKSRKSNRRPESRPPSPLPGSEEYTQRKIQQKSEQLQKQMAECPDNDIVLPPSPKLSEANQTSDRNNASKQNDDVHNDRIIPAIGYLQAALDSTAAELSKKKNAKKTSRSTEQNPSVEEICEAILVRIANMQYKKKFDMVHQDSEVYDKATRHLQRQHRKNVSRELKNMQSKRGNRNNFTTLNAIIPDYVAKLEEMPEKFLAKISSKIDLESEDDFIYNSQDQSSPYDPHEYDYKTENNSQPQFENQYSDNVSGDNNFRGYSGDTIDRQDYVQKYSRMVHMQSQSVGSLFAGNIIREPVPMDTYPDDSQNSIYDPLQDNHSSPSETPPAPQISDISRLLLSHPDDSKREQGLETRNISVIPEASEHFHKPDCDESQESQDTSGTPDEDSKYDRPDVNSNGYNHSLDDDIREDINYRKNFDLKIDDDWNRNVVFKKCDNNEESSELNKVTKCDSLKSLEELKEEVCKVTKVQNGTIEDVNFSADLRKPEVNQEKLDFLRLSGLICKFNANANVTGETWKPLCEREPPEKIADISGDDNEMNQSNVSQPLEDLPRTDTPGEEPNKVKKLYKPDCTSIIVLEPTNKPWTFTLKESKLSNEHMYCKNFSAVNNADGEQLITKPNAISDSADLRPRINPKRFRRNWKHLRSKLAKNRKLRYIKKSAAKIKPIAGANHGHQARPRYKSKSQSATTYLRPNHPKPLIEVSTNDKASQIDPESTSDKGTRGSVFQTESECTNDQDPSTYLLHTKGPEIQTDQEQTSVQKTQAAADRACDKNTGDPEIQTNPERSSGLRQRYTAYKRKTRDMLKQLNEIDKKIIDLLNERRELQKALDAFSSDESEEEAPTKNKKVPKYFITSEGGSIPSKVKNPVLNSVPPSELMLTRIGDNEPTPDSLPDFLMHSLDMDIFSMITQSQTKVPFSLPGETSGSADIGEMEMEDEQFSSVTGEGSATGMGSIDMEESPFAEDNTDTTETTEMEIPTELKIPDVISKTMPADILEPSDNEGMCETPTKNHNPVVKLVNYELDELERMRHGLVNNNVKIEADISSMDGLDSDVISEFVGSEVQVATEPVDTTLDFVEWNDSIVVVKVVENVIVAGNDKGKLFYFDTDSPYPLYAELLSSKAITSICIWKNDNHVRLFIGSLDTYLYVYEFHTRKLLKSITVPAPIQCLEMGWTGLYLGSSKGQLIGYCVNTSRLSHPVSISRDAILAIKALQEGPRRVLLVATRNSPVSIHDASTGLLLRIIGEQLNPTVYSLVFHNNRIYCGTSHDDVLAFNFQDGSFLFKHPEPSGSGVICMTTLRHLLFVACYNGNIYVYDTENNTLITSMSAPRGLFLSMAVTDTKLIAGTKQSFQCMPLPASVLGLL